MGTWSSRGGVGAVLFDAVGTLIRPHPSVGSVYARAAAHQGLRCPPRDLEGHFRRAYRELMPERFSGGAALRTSEGRERRWWKRAVARTFEKAGCGPVPPRVGDAAFDAFASGESWRVYADVVPAMESLAARGVKMGIVSNFDSRLRGVIRDLGIEGYCSALVISSEFGRAKPSALIYLEAVKRLGVTPREALFVGDREEEDYLAPRLTGLGALWLVRNGSRREPHVIRSLRSLPARLVRGPAVRGPTGRAARR